MVYSAGCLGHAPEDTDLIFVDEGHEACADEFATALSRFTKARMWMFSASWDLRLDKKDMRAEALAGPIRHVVTYAEAEAHGMVVPIEVVWTDVNMDVNPCADFEDVAKKRHGFWRNEYRNKLIARDARQFAADTQVLITVETVEHALELKRHLPEFKLMFAVQGEEDDQWCKKNYPNEYRSMTDARRATITKAFEGGKLKRVIATTVWNVGVNFKHLEVLIRADGGGTPINDTQIPGRTSRPNKALVKLDGEVIKQVGLIRDYKDQFDRGFQQRAARRAKSYEKHQWKQRTLTKDHASVLRQLLKCGEAPV
jgi:superfamily II DNA or RNA helicase